MLTKKELEEHLTALLEDYKEILKCASENAEATKNLIKMCEEQAEMLHHSQAACEEISGMYRAAWERCPVSLRSQVFQIPVLDGKAVRQ